VKILAKYLRQLKDRDLLQQSYEISVADHMIPRKQYVGTLANRVWNPPLSKS